MNPKITGIILLVVGIGVALYFFQSKGPTKITSIFKPPATSSIGFFAGSVTADSSTPTSSSVSQFFTEFFKLVFRAPATTTYAPPTLSSGIGEVGNPITISNPTNAGSGGNGNSVIPDYEIPAGYTRAQLSPYFSQIHFGGVSTYEISLYTSGYADVSTSIDITGWSIKTNRGGEYIPQAVNLYSPIGLNPANDIVLLLNQANTVNFYSNSSPTNVRTNECMGYLTATNQFNPPLPNTCPAIDYSVIKSFSGQCQNYIMSLGNCSPVNMASPQIPQYDYACQQYLENNFTYNSCVTNHDHDAHFLNNTWDVWMGGTALDPYHDNVVLLDQHGLVVDTYSY